MQQSHQVFNLVITFGRLRDSLACRLDHRLGHLPGVHAIHIAGGYLQHRQGRIHAGQLCDVFQAQGVDGQCLVEFFPEIHAGCGVDNCVQLHGQFAAGRLSQTKAGLGHLTGYTVNAVFEEGIECFGICLAEAVEHRGCGDFVQKAAAGIRMTLVAADKQIDTTDIRNRPDQLFQYHLAEKTGCSGNQHFFAA